MKEVNVAATIEGLYKIKNLNEPDKKGLLEFIRLNILKQKNKCE